MYSGEFLFAVHLADGVLRWPWLAAGWAAALGLVWFGGRRLADDEVPRVALLAAAFFVASSIHVRVGPTSVHLLLNGLVGVVLGRRACLAIPVGLTLQAVLLGHGGYTSLGLNCCVMALPALGAAAAFDRLRRARRDDWRFVRQSTYAVGWLLHPTAAVALVGVNALLRLIDRLISRGADFRSGFLVGALTVLATAALNALVLTLAGEEGWGVVAALTLAAHLPVALVEGVVVGFTVGFLARVKPEMLRRAGTAPPAEPPTDRCPR
jgi:cobalt/nickel transport system permease protein